MSHNPHKLIHTFAALADVGEEIAHTHNFHEMITTSLQLLLGSLGVMRGGIARFDRFGRDLSMLSIRGLGEGFPLSFPVAVEDEREWLSAGTQPIELDDGLNCLIPFLLRYKEALESRKIELIVPLIVHSELVGVLFLGEKVSGKCFDSDDKEVICAIARHIGVGIHQRNLLTELERRAQENRKLYDNLRLTYKDTVRAFATAIDCKDKYTEGHSVRVGKYCELIAEAMNLPESMVEGIAVGGYLHDVGKLVVDRTIINSPSRITASENTQLAKHPKIGFDILLPIQHPFAEVPLAAKYHHERIDGRGYPDGLSDREIPLVAKIVCLADSFDAMTTDRPYKRRRKGVDVIEDLWFNAGRQFEPELVVALCNSLLKEIKGGKERNRFSRLLGKSYIDETSLIPILQTTLNRLDATSSMVNIAGH